MIWNVFKIFISNVFSFGSFRENFKKGAKGIFKNIGIILLVFYFVVIAFLMIFSYMSTFSNVLLEANKIEYMPVIILMLGLLAGIFFGFISAATNYFTGCGEEQFLSMPLRPIDIFGAKIGVTSVTDLILGVVIVLVSGVIYAFKAKLLANPLFYVGLLSTVAGITSVSLLLIYGILVLVVYFIPKLRKRNILTSFASCLIILFAFFYIKLTANINQYNYTELTIDNPLVVVLLSMVDKLSFFMIFAKAMSGNIVSILIMLALSAGIIFGILPLLAPLYIKSLDGFSDIKSKKISIEKAEIVLKKEAKTQSIFKTLLARDVKTMFREPSFFANGPLSIILIPVIFAISFGVSLSSAGSDILYLVKEKLPLMFAELSPEKVNLVKYMIVMICAGLVVFMGNITSVAPTSFSREGKALYDLKAMPIDNTTIASVKFFHAFLYCICSYVLISILLVAAYLITGIQISLQDFIIMLVEIAVVSCAISLVLIFTDMFIDTVNPKLLWEVPTAAFKQNMNALVAAFITMGVVGIFALLAYLLPKNSIGIIVIFAVFALIAAPLGYFYFRYAAKKITRM